VVKVKEIQPGEFPLLAPGSTIFSFQHLVGEPARARAMAARGVTAVAYELVRDMHGGIPLLAPMSALAGRLAIQVGAHLLTLPAGGNGTLLASLPGTAPARVLVLGGGHAGVNAADAAAAVGASVCLLTRSAATRDAIAARFGTRLAAGLATPEAIEREALAADLVVGAVFVPGAPTPKLLPRSLVRRMKRGAVIVDVSIDAGGVAETSRPTTHAVPSFVEEGVVHYCVANMPAAVAGTAASALSGAALPYVRALAGKGISRALREDEGLRAGLVIWRGRIVQEDIATHAGVRATPVTQAELA
jgi:alanine dehydrogenase